MGVPVVLAACKRTQGGAGGSGRQGKGQRPQAGLLGQELESRMQSQHVPQLKPVGHCNWLRKDASMPGEAVY